MYPFPGVEWITLPSGRNPSSDPGPNFWPKNIFLLVENAATVNIKSAIPVAPK